MSDKCCTEREEQTQLLLLVLRHPKEGAFTVHSVPWATPRLLLLSSQTIRHEYSVFLTMSKLLSVTKGKKKLLWGLL